MAAAVLNSVPQSAHVKQLVAGMFQKIILHLKGYSQICLFMFFAVKGLLKGLYCIFSPQSGAASSEQPDFPD